MNWKSIQFNTIHNRLVHRSLSLAVPAIFFLWGIGVGAYEWPPSSLLRDAKQFIDREFATAQSVSLVAPAPPYQVKVYRQSYFSLNDSGQLETKNGLTFRSEGTYSFERTINPSTTAIIIMDPWVDMTSAHLNEVFGQVTESRILPLVTQAIERGHPIIALTNDPTNLRNNTKIHPVLEELAANGQIEILYHQDFGDEQFAAYLHTKGIDTLIYTGFASNMCVIGRQMGMIPMIHQGFKIFFVPEASAAVEYPDTWENQSIHRATTQIVSQWIAEIIAWDEFMNAAPTE